MLDIFRDLGELAKRHAEPLVSLPCETLSRPQEGGDVNGQDWERRELESAGWEPQEREDETVWRSPESGLVYPQGVAVAMVREGADPDVPKGPEGGA